MGVGRAGSTAKVAGLSVARDVREALGLFRALYGTLFYSERDETQGDKYMGKTISASAQCLEENKIERPVAGCSRSASLRR